MGYLIDTSIFIAWERGDLDLPSITAAKADERVALSVVTASELLHGVERADTAQRRARRATFVEAVLDSIDIVPIDLDVSRVHARIWADLRARGELVGAHDLFIAATAFHHNLTIATRNPRHFERVEGLPVEIW